MIYSEEPILSHRFLPRKEILYNAVLMLKDNIYFGFQEFDFGFKIWKNFPSQITGYVTLVST